MMKGGGKQYIACLCLFLFTGIFSSAFAVAGNAATQTQCITLSNAAELQDPGISCTDQCEAECEPGHWYSGLCRGVCMLGCSRIPPDFPGV